MTISDIDVYRAAKLYVDKHGDDAPVHAAMMQDQMLEKGDMDGWAVWGRIVEATEVLLLEGPTEGARH